MCTNGCYHCGMLYDMVRALLALHQGRLTIPLHSGSGQPDFSFWTTQTDDGKYYLNFVSDSKPSNVIDFYGERRPGVKPT